MSAEEASPAAVESRVPSVVSVSPADSVRALQHALYRAAKADPGRRFHALRDKVYRRDVLWRAWVNVRRNDGAAGIDRITLAMVEEYGVTRVLDEVAHDLREGSYRPLAARRVFIPKPGSSERRPLSIPTVRDRIVQAAAKIVLEPIFEADMLDCSFGFRPRRSAHDALQVLIDESWRGRRWVVETDIASCFEAIPHHELMLAVEERVSDQGVLRLLRAMLRAGVMQDGSVRKPVTGTPQGGVVSPVLANLFMHYAFDAWMDREHPGITFARYVDDVVVHATTLGQADRLRSVIAERMVAVGLELHPVKTKIVYCKDNGRRGSYEHESFTFLGFTFRARSALNKYGVIFPSFLPAVSREALKAMGQRVRGWRVHLKVSSDLADLARWMNPIVRGWMQYLDAVLRAVLPHRAVSDPATHQLLPDAVGSLEVPAAPRVQES